MKTVQVLMSSYNGEKYIREQIDSVLNQKNVNVDLLIRDDGSVDNTVKIIRSFQNQNLHYVQGDNVGATKSFFKLIEMAGNADYYALCDQDDVWDDDKLLFAINKIEKHQNLPVLYSSNTRLVDKNLMLIRIEDDKPATQLGSAFVKNYVTGCTVVFNSTLLKLLKNNLDIDVAAHDWWINLVTLACGGMSIYDENAHMSYRQHDNNVTGASVSTISKWKMRFKRFKGKPYHRDVMAKTIIDKYGEIITEESEKVLREILDLKKHKINFFKYKELRTNKKIDNILFAICVLVNKL